MNFENIYDATLDNLPQLVVGCNIVNCQINNAENTTFERCNIRNSVINTISSFDRTNIINTSIVEGSTLVKSTVIIEEER